MVLSINFSFAQRLVVTFVLIFAAWLISGNNVAHAKKGRSVAVFNAELKRASEQNQLSRMSVALREGADVNSGALVAAAKANHLEALNYLLEQSDINVNYGDGEHFPLDYAVLHQNLAMVVALVAHKAKLSARSTFSQFTSNHYNRHYDLEMHTLRFASPLFVAVVLNNIEIVKVLLNAEANPNQSGGWLSSRDYDTEETLIDYAARQGNTTMVELLLEYGAVPNDHELVCSIMAKMISESERRHLSEALNASIGDAQPQAESTYLYAPLRELIVDYACEQN